MNLSTEYLGLKLKNPLVAGASPLVDHVDKVRQLEDAGVAAVVMHSLFAEQIEGEAYAESQHLDRWENNFPEADSFFPASSDYALGSDEYLTQIGRLKAAVDVPVIASLNGTRPGDWIDYATQIEAAGADALELNTYTLPIATTLTGAEMERQLLEVVTAVRAAIDIPFAVKISRNYTAVAHVVADLERLGADGVVMFNRFFQPHFDLDELAINPRLDLSTPEDLRLRLRWIGILRDQVKFSLACSGGVHHPHDVVRALLAGADAVQTTALLLKHGLQKVTWLRDELAVWLEANEYQSVAEVKGALCYHRCPDRGAYERSNYLRTLQLWRS